MKPLLDRAAESTPALILQEMRVELLRNCPLLCMHCSAHAAPHHTMLLPLQRVLSLLDEFADCGGCRVTFTGGEPFMYPELEMVLQRCHERGLAVRVFSSGIILDGAERRAGCDVLQHLAPYLDTIMYSVYSAHPDAHDFVTRIPGSLALTMKAVKQTVALGIDAELHFVPTIVNYRDLPAVVELAATHAVLHVGILRFVPHGRGKAKADELVLHRDAHIWLRRTIIELRKRYPQITLSVGSAYNLLHVGEPVACSAGLDQMVVEANGNIVPCSAFSNFHVKDNYGNILHHSLQTVWQQSLYLQKVRQALAQSCDCMGCLAQKTIASNCIDEQGQDPLEGLPQ